MKPKIIGVIPARLNSTRLPKKVLAPIMGKPMIEHVYTRSKKCALLDELYVATDSNEVLSFCEKAGINAIMTADQPSGSDRVHEVLSKTDGDIYLNIQGDEPMITAKQLDLVIEPFLTKPDVAVATLKVKISDDEAQNPNNVKVITDINDDAIYFSRSVLPHNRDNSKYQYFKHLGIYAYQRDILDRFHQLPPCQLEQTEKLEQLRLLYNGIKIQVIETEFETFGVDTIEDLKKVEDFFLAHPEYCQ